MSNKGNTTYYAIVTSLPALTLDNTGEPDYRNLAKDFKIFLSVRDYNWLRYVYEPADISNFINHLFKSENAWVQGGNYDTEHIAAGAANKLRLFDFQDAFFNFYNTEFAEKPLAAVQKKILSLYYAQLVSCGNHFLENWGRFSLALNNYVILLYGDHLKIDLSDELIILPDQLTKPLLRVLEQELNEIVQTSGLSDIITRTDITIKEKFVDSIKWDYLEASTFFEYFSLEKLISHALKNQLANRWKLLNAGTRVNTPATILKTII